MLLISNQHPYASGVDAIFAALIRAGEAKARITLPFSLRIFLKNCLVEHLHDPDIVHSVLALSFLESSRKPGAERIVSLRRAGDASLILAGLYPERALRLNVSPEYFRFMGQSSYASLAAQLMRGLTKERGIFFNEVTAGFESLERVLSGTRERTHNIRDLFRRFHAPDQFIVD